MFLINESCYLCVSHVPHEFVMYLIKQIGTGDNIPESY